MEGSAMVKKYGALLGALEPPRFRINVGFRRV